MASASAVAVSLAKRGVKALGLVDRNESVGVHAAIVHPGFTNTPMVRVLGEGYIKKNILPYTQLGRLIEPSEIAEAICFLISNSEVSEQLWADAGWHPPF